MARLNIMVVDDEKNICELLRLYLEKEDFDVTICNNGSDAISLIRQNQPSLVLLDIMMPVIDGWEVCRQVREFSNVPIIMLTAKGETFDKVMGLDLGADDYIVKPFDTKEVVARVKAVLRRSSSADTEGEVITIGEEEAEKAVEELIRRGHKEIAALISASDDHSISQLRYLGYVKALKAHKLPVDDSRVIRCGSFNMKDAYEATKKKLEEGVHFTAVFAIADNMAIGAMRALREAGIDVPSECSLISIDGIEVSEYIDPMLSTLTQPMKEMGRKSVEQLAELIGGTGKHSQITVKTSLREGASMRNI